MDQKVTPDVICFIADTVVNYLQKMNDKSLEFTVKDIWDYDYFNNNVKILFSKPDVNEKTAQHEYDKLIQQPMKMLSYGKILKCVKRGNKNYFKVIEYDILSHISLKELNAYNFLIIYLNKVLKDSGLILYFNKFKDNNTKEQFQELKETFISYIINNTKINKKLEPSRIFTKIINPFAASNKIHGTEKGQFSPNIISNSDLIYNRRNWRDKGKDKQETRQIYAEENFKKKEECRNYYIEKAKLTIKRLHKCSEVMDDCFLAPSTQIHHIFMKSEFPEISDFKENLIMLTPSQHLGKAHPQNNTRIVDKKYQLICLIAKSKSIEQHLKETDLIKNIYCKDDFIRVVNTGLNERFTNDISFNDIINKLIEIYI
jgi:hypothetical protein